MIWTYHYPFSWDLFQQKYCTLVYSVLQIVHKYVKVNNPIVFVSLLTYTISPYPTHYAYACYMYTKVISRLRFHDNICTYKWFQIWDSRKNNDKGLLQNFIADGSPALKNRSLIYITFYDLLDELTANCIIAQCTYMKKHMHCPKTMLVESNLKILIQTFFLVVFKKN